MLIAICELSQCEFQSAIQLMQHEYPHRLQSLYFHSTRPLQSAVAKRWLIKPTAQHNRHIVYVLGGLTQAHQANSIRLRKGHLWHWRAKPSRQIIALKNEPWVSLALNDPHHIQEVFAQLLFDKGFLRAS